MKSLDVHSTKSLRCLTAQRVTAVTSVNLAPERKRKRMPEHEAYAAVVSFARERGALKAHTRGSLAPYLWPLMELAYLCRIIAEEDRFNSHGLKHRGITDTAGNKGDKKTASGRKTDAALEEYDHEVPTIDPANAPEFSGVFSGEGEEEGSGRA